MCLVQKIISLILSAGNSGKQVFMLSHYAKIVLNLGLPTATETEPLYITSHNQQNTEWP